MNKKLKSLPLLIFALCVAVQQSDSAVSAVLLLSFLQLFLFFVLFLHLLRPTSYEHEEQGRLGAGGAPLGSPSTDL